MPRYFNSKQLKMVDEAVLFSEELVNNYFKMSSSGWLKNRYDIQTAKDLEPHELVSGPVAQVMKYEARRTDAPLGSSSFSLYKVCLQDGAILDVVERKQLMLEPFLLYILSHELIHVVRFSRFKHRYEKSNEADATFEEECKVHGLTHAVLKSISVSGIEQVFDFYRDWIAAPAASEGVKNLDKPA